MKDITIRRARQEDAGEFGRIIYDAFKEIAGTNLHRLPLGIGPVTADPNFQSGGAGSRLMEAASSAVAVRAAYAPAPNF